MISPDVLQNVVWPGLSGRSLDMLVNVGQGDPGILRPFMYDGKCYVTLKNKDGKDETHRVPHNTTALPHEVWLEIDQAVTRAAQSRLRAVADLRQQGLTRVIPNGFGVMALLSQRASRTGTAKVGMDPTEKGPTDNPVVDSVTLPLPCIWADSQQGARQLAVSRRGGLPLDTAMMEDGGRACALMAEKMLIGNSDYDQYKYIASAIIYGYTDHPSRVTFTITDPTTSGWVPATLMSELRGAKQSLIDAKRYGPYVLYMGTAWDQYLENDYVSTTAGQTTTITLRERILKADGITDIRELDELSGYDILLVQMDSETVREVIGMEFTTVQWEEQGGQVLNYKVLGIHVPQIRADYDGNCGIAHGSTS